MARGGVWGGARAWTLTESPARSVPGGGNNLLSGFLRFCHQSWVHTLDIFPGVHRFASSILRPISHSPLRRPGERAGETHGDMTEGPRLAEGMADWCFACFCRNLASYENEEQHMSVYEQSQNSPGVEVT
jgi:hypothetical protein